MSSIFMRVAIVVIMAMHSLPSFITGNVIDFGDYLSKEGFGNFGIPIAIGVKLVHLVSIPFQIFEREWEVRVLYWVVLILFPTIPHRAMCQAYSQPSYKLQNE